MIAYVDTSALVPLLIDEPSSPACERLWNGADEAASVRVAYVEAAAALAQARRLGRLSPVEHSDALGLLADIWPQLNIIEIDQKLTGRAAALADMYALRGYDATHCAGAESIRDGDLVAASGDQKLIGAWQAMGLNTFDVNAGAES